MYVAEIGLFLMYIWKQKMICSFITKRIRKPPHCHSSAFYRCLRLWPLSAFYSAGLAGGLEPCSQSAQLSFCRLKAALLGLVACEAIFGVPYHRQTSVRRALRWGELRLVLPLFTIATGLFIVLLCSKHSSIYRVALRPVYFLHYLREDHHRSHQPLRQDPALLTFVLASFV